MDLDKNFFEEEIISGYRVTKEVKQLWSVYLDLLQVFQEICNKNKLKFFMGFGTLLGAFRHGGFIPWDDDVDILMPRSDFDKLQNLNLSLPAPYFLQTPKTDKNFWHKGMIRLCNSNTTCIAKEDFYKDFNQGIAIEIIPLDKCPVSKDEQKNIHKKIAFYQKMFSVKTNNNYYQKQIIKNKHDRIMDLFYKTVSKFFSIEYLKNKINNLCTRFENQLTKYYCIYTSPDENNKYKMLRMDDFSDMELLPFENLLLPAPKGYWRCLENQYGKDFYGYVSMQKRIPHHPAFWALDEGYKVYKKRINNVFENTNGKIIVIFGTGNMLINYEKKSKGEYIPQFYVDNDSSKWGTKRNGIDISNPKVLLEYDKKELHIIICNNYFREIGAQLRNMGLNEYYIYLENIDFIYGSPAQIDEWQSKKNKKYKIVFMDDSCDIDIVEYIKQIKKLKQKCEYLIIGINKKNIVDIIARKEVLSAIKYIDKIVIINDNNRKDLIKKYYCDYVATFDIGTNCDKIIKNNIMR